MEKMHAAAKEHRQNAAAGCVGVHQNGEPEMRRTFVDLDGGVSASGGAFLSAIRAIYSAPSKANIQPDTAGLGNG